MDTLSRVDKKAYEEWLVLCEQISTATAVVMNENDRQRDDRKNRLVNNLDAFVGYYFPHYATAELAWFHRKGLKDVVNDPKIFAVWEWPREHAKSVFADIILPMYLYAIGELTGMILVSNNSDKATTLLGDIQAEFISNQRWIADFGNLKRHGDWSEGGFSTSDGVGFWALGRGQSPRGLRKFAKRPNYATIDDIDDKDIVRNLKRVKEAVQWIREDLIGALSIKGPSRVVMCGNRIHPGSILAHIVGDVQPGDPKNKAITHLKVYATEDPKSHKKKKIDEGGKPAWPRYSITDLLTRFEIIGTRAANREYYHEHSEEGIYFKEEWIAWAKMLKDEEYHSIIVYCDPSFKDDGDFKAIVVLGRGPKYIDVLYAWVRKASVSSMVKEFYDIYEAIENHAYYYIEANMLQDTLMQEFFDEGLTRNYQLPIRGDKRKKPDKIMRVENLTPHFERGLVRFNEKYQKTPDMQELKNQFLGFPFGHDDGPDAFEGGHFLLEKRTRSRAYEPRKGGFTFANDRYA